MSRDKRIRSSRVSSIFTNFTDSQRSSGIKVDQRPREAQVDMTGLDSLFLSQLMAASSQNSAAPSGSGQQRIRVIQPMEELEMFQTDIDLPHQHRSAHLQELQEINQTLVTPHEQLQPIITMASNAAPLSGLQLHVPHDHGESLYRQISQASNLNGEQGYSQTGSYVTTEGETDAISIIEDKRRRNTAASARFRIKKKHKTLTLERTVADLKGQAEDLEREADELRHENGWLKEMLIMKSRKKVRDAEQHINRLEQEDQSDREQLEKEDKNRHPPVTNLKGKKSPNYQ